MGNPKTICLQKDRPVEIPQVSLEIQIRNRKGPKYARCLHFNQLLMFYAAWRKFSPALNRHFEIVFHVASYCASGADRRESGRALRRWGGGRGGRPLGTPLALYVCGAVSASLARSGYCSLVTGREAEWHRVGEAAWRRTTAAARGCHPSRGARSLGAPPLRWRPCARQWV